MDLSKPQDTPSGMLDDQDSVGFESSVGCLFPIFPSVWHAHSKASRF